MGQRAQPCRGEHQRGGGLAALRRQLFARWPRHVADLLSEMDLDVDADNQAMLFTNDADDAQAGPVRLPETEGVSA